MFNRKNLYDIYKDLDTTVCKLWGLHQNIQKCAHISLKNGFNQTKQFGNLTGDLRLGIEIFL